MLADKSRKAFVRGYRSFPILEQFLNVLVRCVGEKGLFTGSEILVMR